MDGQRGIPFWLVPILSLRTIKCCASNIAMPVDNREVASKSDRI